jgi:DNA-binding protein H-NS
MKSVIDGLNLSELSSLIAAAERRLQVLCRRRPAVAVRRELTALAAAHGYTIGELVSMSDDFLGAARKPARRKAAKVAPKYRDPDNKRNTWSGRGSAPTWLVEKVKRGHSRADFLIPGLARPTAKSEGMGKRSVFKVR